MRIETFTHACGKDRFAMTVQIKASEVKLLQQQAYKDEISVQVLLQEWVKTSLNDLVIFCEGA